MAATAHTRLHLRSTANLSRSDMRGDPPKRAVDAMDAIHPPGESQRFTWHRKCANAKGPHSPESAGLGAQRCQQWPPSGGLQHLLELLGGGVLVDGLDGRQLAHKTIKG